LRALAVARVGVSDRRAEIGMIFWFMKAW
jgi:hypothetical protein